MVTDSLHPLEEVQYLTVPKGSWSSRWEKGSSVSRFHHRRYREGRGTAYSLEPAFREPSGGSIDRDGKDSADDGEEFYRKHHGVGR